MDGKIGTAVAVALLAVFNSPALAGGPSYSPQITVPSLYDPSETITAPVRRFPDGDQVRLPGGTWVRCEINCYHTLRNATIDFWRRYDAPPQ
jgi:hypothetical protein